MENSLSASPNAPRGSRFVPFFLLACAPLVTSLTGCASLGEPTERKPLVPAPVRDLVAEQSGNEVVLSFTVPRESVDRRALQQSPAVEIYRTIRPAQPSPAPAAALVATMPSATVTSSASQGRLRYLVPLTAGDFLPNAQTIESFTVRTRASERKASDSSNAAAVNVYPAPNPIDDLQSHVAQSAIQLNWTAPSQNLVGEAPAIASYHVYRANAEPLSLASQTSASAPKLDSPLVQIAESSAPNYRDTTAQLDKTYAYSIRSAVQAAGKLLESADSNVSVVTLHDVFPPSVPKGIVVVPVPAEAGTPAHLDLSWDINPETDIAGYNVYRSEGGSTPGTKLNSDLLPTPTFRDMNAPPGRAYSYTITAVDRTGNESAASAPVEGSLPAGSP